MCLSPSMMCVDISALSHTLHVFEQEEIEFLHIDVMDGHFVPNLALGTDYIHQLRAMTSIPLDIHLMVENPIDVLPWISPRPGELVSVHIQACRHLQRTLSAIRSTGATPICALNPSERPQVLEYVLDDLGGILIMTVNPGFAGQTAIPAAIRKIEHTRNFLNQHGRNDVIIEADGNVSYDLAPSMVRAGADLLVAGTSSFLKKGQDLAEGIHCMRSLTDARIYRDDTNKSVTQRGTF